MKEKVYIATSFSSLMGFVAIGKGKGLTPALNWAQNSEHSYFLS